MKACGGKSSNTADTGKTQKTLLHFFQQQAQTCSPIDKVICPGCNLQVPKSKLNWHLDHDCKSKNCQKKVGGKEKSRKNKKLSKIDKEKKKVKARRQAVLSDSEDDSDDLCALYCKKNESPNESDYSDACYISPDMVETQLIELESGSELVLALQPDSLRKTSSPYFSPNLKHKQYSSRKRQEKVICYEVPQLQKNGIALLEADWSSPQVTPEKANEADIIDMPQLASRPLSFSPQTKSGKAVKAMMEADWQSPSPVTTPKKNDDLIENQNKTNKICLDSTVRTDSESEDDFQTSFVIGTPKNLKLRNKSSFTPTLTKQKKKCLVFSPDSNCKNFVEKTTPNKIKTVPCELDEKNPNETKNKFENSTLSLTHTGSTTERESLSLSPGTFVNMKVHITELKDTSVGPHIGKLEEEKSAPCKFQSEEWNNDSSSSGSDESVMLFSRAGSPALVTPTRSPSPLLIDAHVEEGISHVRNLFNDTSPCDTNVDPSVNTNMHLNVNKVKSSQDDVFDSLSQPSLQRNKNFHRSPWKIKQGLRSTGLLQNSSQKLSVTNCREKKPTPSPSGSASNSPAKLTPLKNTDEEDQLKNDPTRYRHQRGYYLENFLRILDTVLSQPQDVKLLNDDDLDVIKTFQGLTLQAQKLYVRLFQRKIKWNRISKVEYREICEKEDTQLYINELSYANFLHQENEMADLEEVLQLLSTGELHELCKQMKLRTAGKKEDLVATLSKFAKQQPTIISAFSKGSKGNSLLMKRAQACLGHCCLVNKSVRQVFMRVLMLYGLPRYDDDEEGGQQSQLTTLLMVNMGRMRFPSYDIIRDHAIFQTRDDLIRFENCSQIQGDVEECMEKHRWEAALEHCDLARTIYHNLINDIHLMEHDASLPRFLRRFTSVSLLVYVLTCSVECYQKLKNYHKAVEQLQELLAQTTHLQDYRGRWYDRLALNLEMHLKKPAQAVEVINKALRDPEVRKGHRLSLSIRAERMAASARYKSFIPAITEMPLMKPVEAPKVVIEGRSLPADIPGYKRSFIRQDSDRHAGDGEVTVCSVEELALGHYKQLGYSEGLHREGATVNTLFGIYFWDALYAPVCDVFRSPHQAAPLDLDDANFYEARRQQIDHRLSELCSWCEEEAEVELERIWNHHAGEVSLVAWDLFRNVEHAKGLVNSLGLRVIAAICERLAKDHRFTRSGFPDLIVWNPSTKMSRIVEVKGPNDRLSTKQILWLDYLLASEAVAEVCHVEAIGAKKIKLASPRKISPKKTSKKSPKNNEVSDLENAVEGTQKQKKKKDEGSVCVKNGEVSDEKNITNSSASVNENHNVSEEKNVNEDDRPLRSKSKRRNSDDFEEPRKKFKKNTVIKGTGVVKNKKKIEGKKKSD